jgi:cation transport ATPase
MYSNHSIASAFASIIADTVVGSGKYHIGQGVEAVLKGRRYRIGNREFCRILSPDFPPPPDELHYWVALCCDATPLAWVGLKDSVRSESRLVIADALRGGLLVELLTGTTRPSLRRWPASWKLAKKCRVVIRQNIS